jgi:hypothetical protein
MVRRLPGDVELGARESYFVTWGARARRAMRAVLAENRDEEGKERARRLAPAAGACGVADSTPGLPRRWIPYRVLEWPLRSRSRTA